MTEAKPKTTAAKKCNCAELEKRIEALELSRKADDRRAAAFGTYPLGMFEQAILDEEAKDAK